ncbi:AraC family transcriptional regulator [Enterococcus sp. 10A9_DIV0425]|uniref:AraC family transcriptional regulator n=1 Tax=Candidatus Enterococcus wittei TaxID=1987383 RepID=A0A242K0C5_9ENTE|nr:AraC family transcriptional regulator [Enterococcus sp. 10A9_DIV0425]OTP11013.1 AraC family transcriptional regulator [Enterococcus sp. 10A9_DIV0425]
MQQKKINGEKVNTMVSDQYEIYHVEDVVSQNKTIYHQHDFYEIHATLRGKASFYLNGRQFTIQAGSVLLIHSNDLHRIVRQSTDVFERVYIFITSSFLESRSTQWSNLSSCFQPLGEKRSRVLQVDPQQLKEKLAFIDQYPNKQNYGEDIKYEQSLVDYLIFLNQVVQKEENTQEQNAIVPNERVEQMLQYISKNLSHSLTLEEMEKQFFVSRYHITREFKKHTGFTFHQYVMKKKLIYGKQLLREYRSSSTIYNQCGFSSYPHFLKAFKKEFGLTPKEFLKRNTQNQLVHYEHFEEVH